MRLGTFSAGTPRRAGEGLSSQFGGFADCFLAEAKFLNFHIHLTPALETFVEASVVVFVKNHIALAFGASLKINHSGYPCLH